MSVALKEFSSKWKADLRRKKTLKKLRALNLEGGRDGE